MSAKTSTVGKQGAVVIPASLRRRFGITEGSLVIAEERAEGVLIRPAAAFPLEMYTPERQAEFLLSNAVGLKGLCASQRGRAEDGPRRPKDPSLQAGSFLIRGPGLS